MNPLAELFIRQAKRSACFAPVSPQASISEDGQDCATCLRKRYSYPDCCDAGWTRIRAGSLEPCANHVPGDSGLTRG